MNILLLNITGHFGSTGKIVTDIRNTLIELGHGASIGYGHTEHIDEPQYYSFCTPLEARTASQFSKLGRAQYKGSPFALGRIKDIIAKEKPDVVHIHCINGHCVNIYALLKYLAENRIKTVITHHAEFFYTGSCAHALDCERFITSKCVGCPRMRAATFNRVFASPSKDWQRMYDAVNSFNNEDLIFTAVSPWVKERSLQSPIVSNYSCEVVLNGVDTKIFRFNPNSRNIFDRIKNRNNKIVLHVTHTFNPCDKTDIKGGSYVVELAQMMPNVTFVVIATDASNLGTLPENLYYWGKANSQVELAQLYSGADVTLLTSKRETFSMVTAESLCCGAPVVGFKAGGPESIAIDEYCDFVEYGNMQTLCESITKCYGATYDKEIISEIACNKYSREKMSTDYLTVYNHLLNKKIL